MQPSLRHDMEYHHTRYGVSPYQARSITIPGMEYHHTRHGVSQYQARSITIPGMEYHDSYTGVLEHRRLTLKDVSAAAGGDRRDCKAWGSSWCTSAYRRDYITIISVAPPFLKPLHHDVISIGLATLHPYMIAPHGHTHK